MINRCKFLNPTLNICSEINASCPYMADPHSCSIYDEEFNKPYSTPNSHIEDELHRMGVETERVEVEEAPDWF